jgi:hypothetical protein
MQMLSFFVSRHAGQIEAAKAHRRSLFAANRKVAGCVSRSLKADSTSLRINCNLPIFEEDGSLAFRSIVAGPEDLVALYAAFDCAWIDINQGSPVDPVSVSAARERLGHIIVGLWNADPKQDLTTAAVDIYRSSPDADLLSATRTAQLLRG